MKGLYSAACVTFQNWSCVASQLDASMRFHKSTSLRCRLCVLRSAQWVQWLPLFPLRGGTLLCAPCFGGCRVHCLNRYCRSACPAECLLAAWLETCRLWCPHVPAVVSHSFIVNHCFVKAYGLFHKAQHAPRGRREALPMARSSDTFRC